MAPDLRNRSLLAFGATLVGLLPSTYSTNTARAQSTNVFCPNISAIVPTVISSGPGVPTSFGTAPTTLSAGLCTNGATGAESIAALSSQALSEISQSSTQQSNTVTVEGIVERRREEAERRS